MKAGSKKTETAKLGSISVMRPCIKPETCIKLIELFQAERNHAPYGISGTEEWALYNALQTAAIMAARALEVHAMFVAIAHKDTGAEA